MARPKRTPNAAGKKRVPRKKPRISATLPKIPVITILRYLAVLLFLVLSIAAVFYVVFFQVVVAAELQIPGPAAECAPGSAACPAEGAMERGSGEGRFLILPADAGGQSGLPESHAK